MDELVRLAALDGTWEVGGADRRRGVWPEGMNCVWDPWGPRTARFTLKRETGAAYPDLGGFTPIEIEKGGGVWEGFIDQAPEGDDFGLSIEAVGWPDHGNDDVYQRPYVHSRLTDWVDHRSILSANLARFTAVGKVTVGDGVATVGWARNDAITTDDWSGITLDLGPEGVAARVVVQWERNGGQADTLLYCRGSHEPNGVSESGDISDAFSFALNGAPNGTSTGNFGTPRRYVHLFAYYNGPGGNFAADVTVKLTAIQVYRSAAYESGLSNAPGSVLKASDVLKDGLQYCPLWSQDQSGVDATLFSLPEFAPDAPRTFREQAEAVNAFHGYALKLGRGRRLRFKPLPSKPLLTAPDAPGVTFRNLSKGAAREVYNRVLGDALDGAGQPVRVERWAAQQPGVALEPITSPAPDNPTFATNTASWSIGGPGGPSITRDAAVFDSSPASGRWDIPSGVSVGQTLTETFTGTFERGRLYVLAFRARGGNPGGMDVVTDVRFGSLANNDYAATSLYKPPDATFTSVTLAWVPKADRTGVTLEFKTTVLSILMSRVLYVDTLSLAAAAPTIVDRRGFVRTKVLATNQSIDAATMQQFCDAWMQSHLHTQFRGDLTAAGRALKRHLTGEGVDPFAVGELTMELVHFPNEVDPDTGGLGRDGRIVQVSYDGEAETVQVGIDSTSELFEQLMARHGVLVGAAGG